MYSESDLNNKNFPIRFDNSYLGFGIKDSNNIIVKNSIVRITNFINNGNKFISENSYVDSNVYMVKEITVTNSFLHSVNSVDNIDVTNSAIDSLDIESKGILTNSVVNGKVVGGAVDSKSSIFNDDITVLELTINTSESEKQSKVNATKTIRAGKYDINKLDTGNKSYSGSIIGEGTIKNSTINMQLSGSKDYEKSKLINQDNFYNDFAKEKNTSRISLDNVIATNSVRASTLDIKNSKIAKRVLANNLTSDNSTYYLGANKESYTGAIISRENTSGKDNTLALLNVIKDGKLDTSKLDENLVLAILKKGTGNATLNTFFKAYKVSDGVSDYEINDDYIAKADMKGYLAYAITKDKKANISTTGLNESNIESIANGDKTSELGKRVNESAGDYDDSEGLKLALNNLANKTPETPNNSNTDSGSNTGSNTGNTNTGNTGSSTGSNTGNTGNTGNTNTGNTGSNTGSNSGSSTGSSTGNTNTGSNTVNTNTGNTGNTGNTNTGNTGSNTGNTNTGNTGSNTGSNSGSSTGSSTGNTNTGSNTGNTNTGSNTGSSTGSSTGNTGSSTGSNSGSSTGSSTGNTNTGNTNNNENTNSNNNSVKPILADDFIKSIKLNDKVKSQANVLAKGVNFIHNLEWNNVNKRLGEIRNLDADTGVWARLYHTNASVLDEVNLNSLELQFGADKQSEVSNAKIYSGVVGSVSKAKADDNILKSTGFGVGLYVSAVADNGYYADLVAKVNRYKMTFNAATLDEIKENKTGFLASLELGKRFDVNNFYLEPSVEAIVDYTPSLKLENDKILIKTKSSTNLHLKPALAAGLNLNDNANLRLGAGYIIDVNKPKNATITAKNSKVKEVIKGERDNKFYINLGGSYKINDNLRLNLGYERTFSADYNIDHQINAVVRYTF